MIRFLLLCVAWLAFLAGNAPPALADLDQMDWSVSYDFEKGVRVSWMIDDPEWLTMEIRSPNEDGWIGVGFSPNGGMAGADIVAGWMDSDTGEGQLKDLYAVSNSAPMADPSQDYELLGMDSDHSGLVMRFRRKWNTCDRENDYKIGDETVKLIWAYGELSGGGPNYHGPTQRGVKNVYMKVKSHFTEYPDESRLDEMNIKYMDFKMKNHQVPTAGTSYFCQMNKYPDTEGKKHQIIGWKPIIEEKNYKNLHHFLVYECQLPKGDNAFDHYEKDLGKVVPCYTDNMPPDWNNYCLTAPIVWTLGADGDMFKENVGLPMGEGHGGATYFMFEVHYDNPEEREFIDNSGIRVYYTDDVRENDMGSLWVGSRFSVFQFIPPGASEYHSFGGCTGECTAKTIPPEGISVTHVVLHLHQVGRKAFLRHIRNGVELEPIAVDNNYDYNYQQARPVNPERKILPGDTLLMDCQYDTSAQEKPLFGGITTAGAEMCLAFVHYYPRIPLSYCQWQTEFTEFMGAFGVRRVSGKPLEVLKLPYKPPRRQKFDPPDEAMVLVNNSMGLNPLADLKIKDWNFNRGKTVLDVVNGAPWKKDNGKLTQEVTKKFENGKHYAFCTSAGRVRVPLRRYITTVPKYRKYEEPVDESCMRKT